MVELAQERSATKGATLVVFFVQTDPIKTVECQETYAVKVKKDNFLWFCLLKNFPHHTKISLPHSLPMPVSPWPPSSEDVPAGSPKHPWLFPL